MKFLAKLIVAGASGKVTAADRQADPASGGLLSLIEDCNREIRRQLESFHTPHLPPAPTDADFSARESSAPVSLRQELKRAFGVDLTKRRYGLVQCEKVFRAVVTHQRLGNCLFGGLDMFVAKLGQFVGIAFAGQNGVYDCQACYSRDVADDMVQLQVHLVQRLLHVLDVGRCHLHQALPMPQQRKSGPISPNNVCAMPRPQGHHGRRPQAFTRHTSRPRSSRI